MAAHEQPDLDGEELEGEPYCEGEEQNPHELVARVGSTLTEKHSVTRSNFQANLKIRFKVPGI
jgi:hypothetical protein